jgi:hypothetical protein
VLASVSRQLCPNSPVLAVLAWKSYHGSFVQFVLFACLIRPVACWLSLSGCPLLSVLPGCLLLAVLSFQPCPNSPVRTVTSWQPVLGVLSW